MQSRKMIVAVSVVLASLLAWAQSVQGGYIEVFGGPTYDAATDTGFKGGDSPAVNNTGTAVGSAEKYVGGSNMGDRAVRWDASGTAATELGNLGTDISDWTKTKASAVNDAGTAVGWAYKYVGGIDMGQRAVRWDASGAATELENLGTNSSGRTSAWANAVNDTGTAVGLAAKYVGGNYMGSYAVRWDALGTVATELGNLVTSSGAWAEACAVNGAGTAVGTACNYDGDYRAVRWDASGTAVTELGDIDTDNYGYTSTGAYAVNDTGTAVGYAEKYVGGNYKGNRAVRWGASGTDATELGNLGTDSSDETYAEAVAVNDAGTAVGWAYKYVGGIDMGRRVVRWDASGTDATELGNLGTDSDGYTSAWVYAVNDAGTAVGWARKYVGGNYMGEPAVMWGADGQAIDLNTLIDPDSGWRLISANSISSDGWWIAGIGRYDPDGSGPLEAYTRMWVMGVPEPATLSLLVMGGLAMIRRRRK